MDLDLLEKLHLIRCQTHNKKMQFICCNPECQNVIVCGDCVKKNKNHTATHLDNFKETDEFIESIVKVTQVEHNEIREKVGYQIQFSKNHIAESMILIDKDFKELEEKMINFVKELMEGIRLNIRVQFDEFNSKNLSTLQRVQKQYETFGTEGSLALNELLGVLRKGLTDTELIAQKIQGFLLERSTQMNSGEDVATIVRSIPSVKSLVCTYNFEEVYLNQIREEIEEEVKEVFLSRFENMELINFIIQPPKISLNETLSFRCSNVNMVNSSDEFSKQNQIVKVGDIDAAKHPSHHVHSMEVIENIFLATGHADNTYKIWMLSPKTFKTPKTMLSSNKSEGGSPSKNREMGPAGNNFLSLLYTSDQSLHPSSYVTSLSYFRRISDDKRILVSGDSVGRIVVSEFIYDRVQLRFKTMRLLFQKTVHSGWVYNIKWIKDTLEVMTSSKDGTISIFDTERNEILINKKYHIDAIRSMTFIDNYNLVASGGSGLDKSIQIYTLELALVDEEQENTGSETASQISREDEFGNRMNVIIPKTNTKHKSTVKFVPSIQITNAHVDGSSGVNCLASTNINGDFLLFSGGGLDDSFLRVWNALTGNNLYEFKGAHFKGVYTMAFLINNTLASDVRGTFKKIKAIVGKVKKDEKALNELVSSVLPSYKLITFGLKEKVKIWQLGVNKMEPLNELGVLGGTCNNGTFFLKNSREEVLMISGGSSSAKIELLKITNKN